jgi:hypothetical protein
MRNDYMCVGVTVTVTVNVTVTVTVAVTVTVTVAVTVNVNGWMDRTLRLLICHKLDVKTLNSFLFFITPAGRGARYTLRELIRKPLQQK